MAQCICCASELAADTKPEHILLNALGGRKTTTRSICSACNNDFGGTIDDVLAGQVREIRNLLQLDSGAGKVAPMLKNVNAGAEVINLASDGTPEIVTKPFSIEKRADGQVELKIHVRSYEELAHYVPHISSRLKITEAEVWKLIENSNGRVVERRPGKVHHGLSFGGRDAIRSMSKSLLVLWSTLVGYSASSLIA